MIMLMNASVHIRSLICNIMSTSSSIRIGIRFSSSSPSVSTSRIARTSISPAIHTPTWLRCPALIYD